MECIRDSLLQNCNRENAVPGMGLHMDSVRMMEPWRRLKAKSFRQLVRLFLLKAWPLSILGRRYYRYCYSPDRYQQLNQNASRVLAEQRTELTERQATLVNELRKEGAAQTQFSELIPDSSLTDLTAHVENLLNEPRARAKIENRLNHDDAKWYVVRAFGHGVDMELPPWLSGIVLHPNLLAVISGYLGFCPRLTYVDVWHNFPVSNDDPDIDPEHWHRDHEDRHVFKFFLYLRDIDEGAGPHQYLRRTHPYGEHFGLFPHSPPLGTYPPDAEVEEAVPRELYKVCTGTAGSMVLADTVGFHRGGRCAERPRTLLTATYASNLAIDPNRYRLADAAQYDALDAAGRYAIRAERAA